MKWRWLSPQMRLFWRLRVKCQQPKLQRETGWYGVSSHLWCVPPSHAACAAKSCIFFAFLVSLRRYVSTLQPPFKLNSEAAMQKTAAPGPILQLKGLESPRCRITVHKCDLRFIVGDHYIQIWNDMIWYDKNLCQFMQSWTCIEDHSVIWLYLIHSTPHAFNFTIKYWQSHQFHHHTQGYHGCPKSPDCDALLFV